MKVPEVAGAYRIPSYRSISAPLVAMPRHAYLEGLVAIWLHLAMQAGQSDNGHEAANRTDQPSQCPGA